MPLSGTTQWKEYEVLLQKGDELFLEYVVAKDLEHAAWSALELSTHRNCTLKNVSLTDEW